MGDTESTALHSSLCLYLLSVPLFTARGLLCVNGLSQLSGRMVGFATCRVVAALRAALSGRSAFDCFAAAVQLVLERVQAEFPDCLVVSLHDDGQVAGPVGRARLALARIIELASAECGLVPVGHKFALFAPALDRLPVSTGSVCCPADELLGPGSALWTVNAADVGSNEHL